MTPTNVKTEVLISTRKIKQALVLLFCLNLFMLFGTWLYNGKILGHVNKAISRFVAQLNLGTENVAAAWYSSMLLLLVAVAAACCFFADNQRLTKTKDRILNLGWLGFVFAFLLLSFDEMGSFHEMIGDTDLFKSLGKGAAGGGWYIFLVLVMLVGVFMMLFFFLKFFKNKAALFFAVLGVLLFLSNPFQENYEIDSWHNSPDPSKWQRPMIFLLVEEGSEIFASFFLFYSFTSYLKSSLAKSGVQNNKTHYTITLPGKRTMTIYAVALVVLMSIVMLIVKWNAWTFKDAEGGNAQNWFPSSMAFVASLAALYIYYISGKGSGKNGVVYLLLAFFSMLGSVFFGSNMYMNAEGFLKILDIFILTGSILTAIFAIVKLTGLWTKVGLALWAVLILVAFFTTDFSSTTLEYCAFASLLMALLFDHNHILDNANLQAGNLRNRILQRV